MARLRGEDGTIAVVAAAFMLLALGAAALGVDIGGVVLEQRELRKVADLAALDAVLAVGDRRHEFADPQAAAALLAERSALRNGFDPASDGTLSTEIGRWDPATRAFTPGGTPSNGVRVTVAAEYATQFVSDSRLLSATSVAAVEDVAGIAIGTGLAELDSAESALLDPLLSGLLDTSVSLSALHYQGLAGADVSLGALASALGADLGDPDSFLATEVTVADLVNAMLDADESGIQPGLDGLGALDGLLPSSVPGSSVAFPLGDILDVGAGLMDGRTVASARLNALTLISAGAQAARRGQTIVVPVDVDVLGISGLSVRLGIIEPPQIAVGPARQVDGQWVTQARSAQVRMAVDMTVARASIPLATTDLRLPLFVNAAEGTAALTGNQCAGDPSAAAVTTTAGTTGARLRIAQASDGQLTGGPEPTGPADILTLRATVSLLLLNHTVDVAVRAAADTGLLTGGPTGLVFSGPFGWDNVQQTSAVTDPGALLLSSLQITTHLPGGLLSAVVNLVLGVVTPVVTGTVTPLVEGLLNDAYSALVTPTLSLLGADLATADVTAWHQSCAHRMLTE